MKVTLYLMTEKGYRVLNALVENGFAKNISEVIVGRDRSIANDYRDSIIDLCALNKIDYYDRTDNYNITSPYSVAVSWRWIINNKNSQLIVLHDSLLPRYRGFAPLINALINQEDELGVSAIFASDNYDVGDIIAQSSRKISYPIKIGNAIRLITKNYIEVALKILTLISHGATIEGKPQDENKATYSLWRDENDYLINWNKDANDIQNFINAVSTPYKGASTFINGKSKIRIINAEVIKEVKIENRDPGKVIFMDHGFPVIVCERGLLKITNCIEDISKKSALPFKKFRSKLTSHNNDS